MKLKKKTTLFGRAIPVSLIVAVLLVGITSAALLVSYGTITGTITAQQAVLVDGGDYQQSNTYISDNVAGLTITTEHTLENRAQVPAKVGIVTTSGAELGITTSYQVGDLATRGTSGSAEWTLEDGNGAAHLSAPLNQATSSEGTVVIKLPANTKLSDLQTIAWSAKIVNGYLPHVDIILDTNSDNIRDNALVVEGAHQNNNGVTGWTEGTWLTTFEGASGVYTPGRGIPSTSFQTTEEVKSIQGKSAVWLNSADASVLNTLSEYQTPTTLNGINQNTPVLALEIEVDGWVVGSESFVKDITINGMKYPILSSSNELTLKSGENVGFFIRNGFAIDIEPDVYTITTSVNPVP